MSYFQDINPFALLSAPIGVSLVNILLVALYRYINVVVDPFGNRSIITTPRCILVSISTWLIMAGVAATLARFLTILQYGIVTGCIMFAVFLATGVLYFIIYRAVSRSNNHTEQRLAENKSILKTFALVYATSLIIEIPMGIMIVIIVCIDFSAGTAMHLVISTEILFLFTGILNSLIYWWRLQEFRSAIASLKCRKHAIHPLGVA